MRTIAVTTQKGGVAKTTTAANLAAAWGASGREVLLVDLDPQFGLTAAVGMDPGDHSNRTMVEVMQGKTELAESAVATASQGVAIVPGNRAMREVETGLVTTVGGEAFLREALEPLTGYDLVILDCPPNLGLLSVNALVAAEEIVIPVSTQDRGAFQGAIEVLGLLPDLKRIGATPRIAGLVRVKANPRRVSYREIAAGVASYADRLPVASTEIPDRAEFNNALLEGVPLVSWRPASDGARAYRELAAELDGGIAVEAKAAA